jgi:hypothetical protein
MVHAMRSRIITSPSFSGEKVLGAILFEMTMVCIIHVLIVVICCCCFVLYCAITDIHTHTQFADYNPYIVYVYLYIRCFVLVRVDFISSSHSVFCFVQYPKTLYYPFEPIGP